MGAYRFPRKHLLLLCYSSLVVLFSVSAQDAIPTDAAAGTPPVTPPVAPTAPSTVTVTSESPQDSSRVACRVHVINNTASPLTYGHVQSSLKVLAAADVMDVSVILQVQHADVAALEVSLTAASSNARKKVVLKAPAYGAVGGANMVQTIFSDYAPSDFPTSMADAPYSSVYRPSEPLKGLVLGNASVAGSGGSQGVWSLAVADKAPGDLSRRPLKLTGWELWLCGETDGPLFTDSADGTATAFDGTDTATDVTVIRKMVPTSKDIDANVLIKAGYRKEQIDADPITKKIHEINTWLAKDLSSHFDQMSSTWKTANPQLAGYLNSSMAKTAGLLGKLPGTMGYLQGDDGSWGLPSSEVVIKGFLDTLVHCYYDLFWCWQNTGMSGSFSLDFANTWDERAGPLAASWSDAQGQWMAAISKFQADDGAPSAVLTKLVSYSLTDLLYDAAAVDAVVSVGEAWLDTAVRLAIWASPIRFAVNPRAAVTQALSVVGDALETAFDALQYVPLLVDNEDNNDVAAITAVTRTMVEAAQKTMGLLVDGLGLRAQGMQNMIKSSAGGLAASAADMTTQFGDALKQISPRLGAVYDAAMSPVGQAFDQVATRQQDVLAQYFKTQNYQTVLRQELDRTITLAGDITVQTAQTAAQAFKDAQKQLDDILPGPPLQELLSNLTTQVQGILSDAQRAIESVVPTPQLAEINQLINATLSSILEAVKESADDVQNSNATAAVKAQLDKLAAGLQRVQKDVGGVADQVIKGFPGPLINGTLEIIKREANHTVQDIEQLFNNLTYDYPNLNPDRFIKDLQHTLDGLLNNTLGNMVAFEGLAPFNDSKALAGQVPDALKVVEKAVQDGRHLAELALPSHIIGRPFDDLQRSIGDTMQTYADRINALAGAIPTQPSLADITDSLTQRTQDLSQHGNQLQPAIVDALNAPTKISAAGLSDFNDGLVRLLEDLKSQQGRSDELAKFLAEGPLKDVVDNVNKTIGQINNSVQEAGINLAGILPPLPELPDIRSELDRLLGPPTEALSQVLSEAANAALAAAEAASNGLLGGVTQGTQVLTRLLIDAQWQLAGLLGTAVQAGNQLQAAATNLTLGAQAPLQLLDKNLNELADQVTGDLEKRLEQLRPPIEILENVVRPIASSLNSQLGNITAILSLNAPNLQNGVAGVLEQLQGLITSLVQSASDALGLPAVPSQLPSLLGNNTGLDILMPQLSGLTDNITKVLESLGLPPLPPLPQLAVPDSGNSSKPDSIGAKPQPAKPGSSTKPGEQQKPEKPEQQKPEKPQPEKPAQPPKPEPEKPEKPDKPEKQEPEKPPQPAKPEKQEPKKPQQPAKQKPEKPAQPGKQDSSKDDSKAASRGLLQTTLPIQTFTLQVPNLRGLQYANGSAFDAAAFRQSLVSELTDAAGTFANDFIATALGTPGVSAADGTASVLNSLRESVQGAVQQLQKSLTTIPNGPVFELLMGNNDAPVQRLQALQRSLADGNSTAAAVGDLLGQASSSLRALGGPVLAASGGAQRGDLLSWLAQPQFTSVADGAGKLLDSFKINLASFASSFA